MKKSVKSWKQVLSLILTVAMLVTSLEGCTFGKKKATDATPESTVVSEEDSSLQASEATEPSESMDEPSSETETETQETGGSETVEPAESETQEAGGSETVEQAESETQEAGGSETVEPTETETQEAGGSETVEPAESETQEAGGSETVEPTETETQEAGGSETVEPAESETQEAGGSETVEPTESETQEAGETETKEPTESETQEAGGSETGEPAESETEETEQKPSEAVEAPQATPAGGSYTSDQSVDLRCSTKGAQIIYTTDGTTPSRTNGTKYSAPISVTGTEGKECVTTIKAIAVKDGMKDSAVATFSYTIRIPDTTAPTATIAIGTNKWMQFWNKLTFGLFFKDTKEATIVAADSVTEKPTLWYYLSAAELSEEEAKADGLGWQAYTGAIRLSANSKQFIYAKAVDEAGNVTIVNSTGVVVFTDSAAVTTDLLYVKNTSGDVTADILLNGNTIAGITNGTTALVSDTDYTIGADGRLMLQKNYLKTLPAGVYTLTISYNPMGETYLSAEGNEKPVTTQLTLTVQNAKLAGITLPQSSVGAPNGTEMTAEALGLPKTVSLVMDDAGVTAANVTWDLTVLESGTYDPSVTSEQTFAVGGTVTLPDGVDNPNGVSLHVVIWVTVQAYSADAEKAYSVTLFDGDVELKKVEKPEGTVLSKIASPYVENKVFLGWYYDKDFTQAVSDQNILVSDMALYGKYGDAMPFNEDGSPNYLSANDQLPSFEIIVDAHDPLADAAGVRAALSLTNVTDPSRTDSSETYQKDELVITPLGEGRFSVKAKDGYQEGATYQLEIVGSGQCAGLTFDGQTDAVIYYNFTIKKAEVLNLSLDSKVKYLSVEDAGLSQEDAKKLMEYSGLYQEVVDPETGETSYKPTDSFGTFSYVGEECFVAGDIVAVYEGTTRPDDRNLSSSLEERVAYIEITKANGTLYAYKSAESVDVLFTPDIIPIDIDGGDGVTGWSIGGSSFTIPSSKLDFSTGFADMGLDYDTVVEPGDFVAFYSGDFGEENAVAYGYGRIVAVTASGADTIITYAAATDEEVLASMDIYNETELTQKQLESVDEQMLVAMITDQVIESGFAQEAGMYLASIAVETDEVKDLLGAQNLRLEDCIITYDDGTPVPTDEMMLMANVISGGGNGMPEISVNIKSGLKHFNSGSGFQVELALKYGFDLQRGGSSKIHIEMTAIFLTEIMLRFSASGGAVWKMAWIFPYIYDYQMTGNIDQGLYTNIAITATAQLAENDMEGPELLEPGDPSGENNNLQQIIDLSESIREMMEELKESAEEEDEEEQTGFEGLTDRYQQFIEQASDEWVELVCVPLFSSEGSLDPYYITAYSISIDFVISATMSVAIGMSFQYEKCQRHSFNLMLFHSRQSSSHTVDLTPERYQFDFYVMGTLGVRAGIRAKVLFGVFSVKLAGIGLELEAGAYARLWGYFYYCLSWEAGKGKESSAMGALYMEIGVYLRVSLVLEAINGRFSYKPTLYKNEWPIWSAGDRENALDFAYGEDGTWEEGRKKTYSVPLCYDMVRKKTESVPTEVFRMYYLDLVNGVLGYKTYDDTTRGSNASDSSAYDDEKRFLVEVTEPFAYDPTTNTISIHPEDGVYSYEGVMTITWKQQDITFNTKPLTKTFELSWMDPDQGNCLSFETNGGTKLRTKILETGKAVEPVEDPTKIGYEFGGWYSDSALTKKTSVPKTMPDHDVTLYAKWIPIPNQYTVGYLYESLYNGYSYEEEYVQDSIYTTDDTKKKRVYTDDVIGQEQLIEDNRRDRYGFEIDYERTTQSFSVNPAGDSKVYIYYKRVIHSVTYSMGELKDEENPDVVYRYRFEEPIFEPTLFAFGYIFDGWDRDLAPTMDMSDLTYTAQWTGNPNTPYYLEYYVKNPSTGQFVMLGGQLGRYYKEGRTGAQVRVEDHLLSDSSYKLEKITVNGVETDRTGTGKIDPRGTLTIRYYYEGETYAIAYDACGGELLVAAPAEYTHGFAQELTYAIPQRVGYEFLGWYADEETQQLLTEIPMNSSGDILLHAKWKPRTYTISLYDGGSQLGSVTATYDELLPQLTSIPEMPGYTFAGYRTGDGVLYYDKDGYGLVVWTQTDGISLNAVWQPKKVTINFDGNGCSAELRPIEGSYRGNYPTLPTVSRDGYHLLGWTKKGASEDAYIAAGDIITTYEEHTLVAQWAPNTDTPYTIECYLPSEEGGYTLYSSFTQRGTTDETVTAGDDTYVIPGFAFDASVEGSVLSQSIRADGSTVLKLYYRAGKKYFITFSYGNGYEDEILPYFENTGSLQLPNDLPEDYAEPAEHMVLSGWRLDNVFYEKNSSYSDIESDLTFTAVWEKATYEVFYRLIDGYSERFLQQKQVCDTSYPVLGNLYTKSAQAGESGTTYYEFAGWNTASDGSGTMYQPGDTILNPPTVGGRFDLYAQFREVQLSEDMVPYTVEHSIEKGSNYWDSYYEQRFGTLGEKTTAEAYSLVDARADEVVQQELTASDQTVTITYRCSTHRVRLDLAGGTFNGQTVLENNAVYPGDDLGLAVTSNVELSKIIPQKNGYEFIGWDFPVPAYMGREDVFATAQYKETGYYPVTVEHYVEDLAGGTYTLVQTDKVYAKLGEFTPPKQAYAGFITPEDKKVTVTEDGASCKYYYDRASYVLAWDAGEGTLTGEGYTSGSVRYGEAITAPGLSRAGYTGKWKNLPATMPAQDMTVTPEWTAQKVNYHVMYYYQDSATSESYAAISGVLCSAYAGSIVEPSVELPASASDEIRSLLAQGYAKPLPQTVEIAGDGSTTINYYYRLKKYHLYYDFSGGVPIRIDAFAPAGEYAYGRQLQLPLTIHVERSGYRALGWYDASDPQQTLVKGITITIPDHDVVYKLKWEPVTYTITYELDSDSAENPNNPTHYQTGFDFNISGALREHYAFAGWEWSGTGEMPSGVSILENGLVHVSETATGELCFKAKWDPLYKQFVGRMDEDSEEFYQYSYPEDKDITIREVAAPTRDGYIFEYWTRKVANASSGYTVKRIYDGTLVSTLNVNTDFIVAKWMKISEMGDGYYRIHVSTDEELEDAIQMLKTNPVFRGITLEDDVFISAKEHAFERFEDGYVLDGNNHILSITGEAFIGENYGTIQNLRLKRQLPHTAGVSGEDTYFGILAEKNYGKITSCTNCWAEGYPTYAQSDATYVGGLVGYNEGIIEHCRMLRYANVKWDAESAFQNGRMTGYVGGIAGFNAYNGVIKSCRVESMSVTLLDGEKCHAEQTVYLGSIAGKNHGLISYCEVSDGITGYWDLEKLSGSLYAGGIAGIDDTYDVSDKQKNIKGIYNCKVSERIIFGSSAAGGLMGECNYSVIEANELISVTVSSNNGYAGQIAGIFDSTVNVSAYSYITDAVVSSESGRAGVLAGYGRNWEDNYVYGLPYGLVVRSRDDKTMVTNGQKVITYRKGCFSAKHYNNQFLENYTDAAIIVGDSW